MHLTICANKIYENAQFTKLLFAKLLDEFGKKMCMRNELTNLKFLFFKNILLFVVKILCTKSIKYNILFLLNENEEHKKCGMCWIENEIFEAQILFSLSPFFNLKTKKKLICWLLSNKMIERKPRTPKHCLSVIHKPIYKYWSGYFPQRDSLYTLHTTRPSSIFFSFFIYLCALCLWCELFKWRLYYFSLSHPIYRWTCTVHSHRVDDFIIYSMNWVDLQSTFSITIDIEHLTNIINLMPQDVQQQKKIDEFAPITLVVLDWNLNDRVRWTTNGWNNRMRQYFD